MNRVRVRFTPARILLSLHEEKVLAAWERAVGVWLLPSGGCFHHVVTNQAEHLVDLDTRSCDSLHNRHREWAVVAITVERHLALLGGEHNECCTGYFDLAEPTADRACADRGSGGRGSDCHVLRRRPPHLWCKRVVATGIEQQQLKLPGAFERGHDLLERDGFELRVAVGRELGVDGNEVIDTAHLDAMAGVV